MSLVNKGGLVDNRFNIVAMCQAFGWTYEDYVNRPLWFDEFYRIKCKAEAAYQEKVK